MEIRSNVKLMFIGSELSENKSTTDKIKLKERMAQEDRKKYINYQFKNKNHSLMIIDEYKLTRALDSRFQSYQKLFFTENETINKQTLTNSLISQFSGNAEGSIIIYSGAAQQEDGAWEFASLTESGAIKYETFDFNEVEFYWKKRSPYQRHLLVIIDSNYSEFWLKAAEKSLDKSISIQASCLQKEKSCYDEKIGSYFLHNWCKILNGSRNEAIMEPKLSKQTPCFIGNSDEVYNLFGFKMNFNNWVDMRGLLNGGTKFVQQTMDLTNVDPRDLNLSTNNIHTTKCMAFFNSKYPINQNNKTASSKLGQNDTQVLKEEQIKMDSTRKEIPQTAKKLGSGRYADIFDGEIDLENKKQGKGIWYNWNHEKKFDGEFINDLKNGQGIEYNVHQIIVYKGEFKNNKRDGTGQIFDREGNLIFEGIFKDDLKNGQGKDFSDNGNVIFEGIFANGSKNGFGKEFYRNGIIRYEGNWVNDKLSGEIKEYNDNGKLFYEGYCINGVKNGNGILYFPTGNVKYEGSFKNGVCEGEGVLKNEEGKIIFLGLFVNGKPANNNALVVTSILDIDKNRGKNLKSTLSIEKNEKLDKELKKENKLNLKPMNVVKVENKNYEDDNFVQTSRSDKIVKKDLKDEKLSKSPVKVNPEKNGDNNSDVGKKKFLPKKNVERDNSQTRPIQAVSNELSDAQLSVLIAKKDFPEKVESNNLLNSNGNINSNGLVLKSALKKPKSTTKDGSLRESENVIDFNKNGNIFKDNESIIISAEKKESLNKNPNPSLSKSDFINKESLIDYKLVEKNDNYEKVKNLSLSKSNVINKESQIDNKSVEKKESLNKSQNVSLILSNTNEKRSENAAKSVEKKESQNKNTTPSISKRSEKEIDQNDDKISQKSFKSKTQSLIGTKVSPIKNSGRQSAHVSKTETPAITIKDLIEKLIEEESIQDKQVQKLGDIEAKKTSQSINQSNVKISKESVKNNAQSLILNANNAKLSNPANESIEKAQNTKKRTYENGNNDWIKIDNSNDLVESLVKDQKKEKSNPDGFKSNEEDFNLERKNTNKNLENKKTSLKVNNKLSNDQKKESFSDGKKQDDLEANLDLVYSSLINDVIRPLNVKKLNPEDPVPVNKKLSYKPVNSLENKIELSQSWIENKKIKDLDEYLIQQNPNLERSEVEEPKERNSRAKSINKNDVPILTS